MAGEWRDVRLREVATLITKGTTPTTLGMPFVPSGVNYIKAESVTDVGTIDRSKFAFIDPTTHAALRRSQIEAGDLLMSMAGVYLGKVAVVPPEVVPANTNQAVAIIRLGSAVDSSFVAYYLRNREFNVYINSLVAQSAQPNLNLAEIGNLPLRLPTLSEQRAIAHILGTLDDKIELNRRMNETLEAMARALFKSWFVDFDPVRAKQVGWVSPSGRNPPIAVNGGLRGDAANPPYGLPPHILDLFPDSFEDSELGEIPKGWRFAPLPDVIDVNPTRALRKGVEAPYLDMANMPTQGHSPDEVVGRAFGSGMRFVNGDTLVARITPCLENGKTAFVDFLEPGQVGWGSTEYIVLRPKPPLSEEFAYCLARSAEFHDFAIQSMTGSSGRQRVPAESLSHFRLVVVPKPIAEAFGRVIKPLFARASAASIESRTLATLRDALLPKLISGELRVRAAERLIEEASA